MKKCCCKITFSLVIAMFTFSFAFGQKPLPRIVTGDDFLGKYVPPVVYDIEIDTNGIVYMVFPGGLWKFNGFSNETNWQLENTYDPTIYFALHKGYNDQMLLSGPYGVAYIKGDSIIKFPLPDSLIHYGKRGYESVYTDKDGLLHISPRYKGYYTVDLDGKTTEVIGLSSEIHGFVADRYEDGKTFTYSIVQPGNREKKFSLYSSIADSTLKYISEIDFPQHESSLVHHQDGSFIFSNGKKDIVHFDNNGFIKVNKFEDEVIKLFIDSKDFLWIGTLETGIFKVLSKEFKSFENYLNGSTAVLAESFDNGIWLKSDKEKFGYISPLGILNYSDQNGYPIFSSVDKVVRLEDQILVVNDEDQIFIINDDKVIEFIPPGIDQDSGIPTKYAYPRRFSYDKITKKIWVAYYGELQGWDGNNWEILKFDRDNFKSLKVRVLKVLHDGRVVGATQNEFFEIKQGKIITICESTKSNILDFTADDLGKLWVTRHDGLWHLEDGVFRRPIKQMPKALLLPAYFIEFTMGSIWYQSVNDGLYQIKEGIVKPVFDQYGQRIKIYNYSIAPDGSLWAGLMESGYLCRIEEINNENYFHYYEFDDLARLAYVSRGLLVTDKDVFIAGKHGLFRQSIAKLTSSEIPSKVVITELRINHELKPVNDEYNLAYDENYINITFNGISFRTIPLKYSYQMSGLDTVWRETKHRHVQYTNLSPGEYNFKLRVKPKNKQWSSPETITFIIDKPYWQKWWFWISALVTFLSIGTMGIQLRINHVRNKESEKGRIALELSRLELRALKAQMNPHFIFNALKSIQNRILKEGKWEANDLLVRFSKLIRTSLEYSRVDFISLSKEIEFLNNYLEIEKQRIPGKFNFEITIDQIEEMQDLLVPSLLIQPICENAINHAFEKSNGNLILQLKLISQDLIEVNIKDDGIGYFSTKNTSRENNHSRGLEIVHSRLELFKSQGYDTSIQIEPLNEITNQGTKVTLRMPCK